MFSIFQDVEFRTLIIYVMQAKSSAMKSIKAARDDKRNRLAQVLKDYSPWLYTYRSPGGSFDIEIPGQYSGNQR